MLATWRKKVTYTTEYLLPGGAPIGEFYKAAAFAWARYCEAQGVDPSTGPSDDWARVTFDDEHVIIHVQTSEVSA